MKERIILTVKSFGALLGGGLLYYLIYSLTGIGLICPMNFVTGWLCPCCGISRMLISLMKFDFAAAFYYNAGILIFMPLWLTLCALYFYNYIKTGNKQMKKWMSIVLYFTFAVMLIFGILRNIVDLGLAPSDSSLITKIWRLICLAT